MRTHLVITNETASVNIGNCIDLNAGIFTAKTSGIYEFSISMLEDTTPDIRIRIFVNGNVYLQVYDRNDSPKNYSQVSRTWMIKLEAQDTLHLVLVKGSMHGDRNADVNFTEFIEN